MRAPQERRQWQACGDTERHSLFICNDSGVYIASRAQRSSNCRLCHCMGDTMIGRGMVERLLRVVERLCQLSFDFGEDGAHGVEFTTECRVVCRYDRFHLCNVRLDLAIPPAQNERPGKSNAGVRQCLSQFVGQEGQPAFKERCPSFHHQRAGGPVKKMRGSIEIVPCQGILDGLLDVAMRSVPGCRAPVQCMGISAEWVLDN